MKNIILCGMMGCGKTTCANLLGTKLGRQVVDTDDLVVKKAGMSISELFAAQGEAAVDVLPEHDFLQGGGGSQRGATGAGLEGEALLQQA